MKGTYLSNIDPDNVQGYDVKISGQVSGFNKLNIDIDLICFTPNSDIICRESFIHVTPSLSTNILKHNVRNLVLRRIYLYFFTIRKLWQQSSDFLYLRHPRSDPLFILFLTLIRLLYGKITIFYEIPTYPYDHEYENTTKVKDKIVFFFDRMCRKQLKKYITRIVVVSFYQPIFDIPILSISNGINISETIELNRPPSLNKSIHIIGVGNIEFWHGFDRVISGLKNYYISSVKPEIDINFHIVSPYNKCIEELLSHSESSHLIDKIKYHGENYGDKLNKLYDQCHLAIGDLGCHRKGMEETAALKVREYAARGIPFVSSAKDPDFPNSFPYRLLLKADDTPINMSELVEFVLGIYEDTEHPKKIYDYAVNHLDWSIKLKKVIEAIPSSNI